MLNSDKAKDKIVRQMQNVPYDFNVYFVKTNESHYTTKLNKRSMPDAYEFMGIKPEQAPIIENKINMFVTSWGSDPPTAWMIIHRFAHSNSELTSYVNKILSEYGRKINNKWSYPDYEIVNSFGTMRSARTGQLSSGDESSHEIITQYIMTRKITFDIKRKKWATTEHAELLKELEVKLQNIIGEYLKNATNYVYFLF
jgi:hypothetical protein